MDRLVSSSGFWAGVLLVASAWTGTANADVDSDAGRVRAGWVGAAGPCTAEVEQVGRTEPCADRHASAPTTVPASSATLLVLNLGGSPSATRSSDWASFRSEWIRAFGSAAAAAGIGFAVQDGAPRATGQAGTLVAVTVRDHRHRAPGGSPVQPRQPASGGSAGEAYVRSDAVFRDLASGTVLGRQAGDISSITSRSLLASGTREQVAAIAANVVGRMAVAAAAARTGPQPEPVPVQATVDRGPHSPFVLPSPASAPSIADR